MVNVAVEQSQMRTILETYTYEDFQKQHQNWLKSGQQLWYVTGNYGHEEAIQLVEKARSHFNLEHIKIEELADVRTMAIEDGHSFHVERSLEDKQNENSCNITYYEIGIQGSEKKEKLTNSIVMQFLSEPFFNELRTQQ
jgi:secreted Zn-dependent insulinase-like peptidase